MIDKWAKKEILASESGILVSWGRGKSSCEDVIQAQLKKHLASVSRRKKAGGPGVFCMCSMIMLPRVELMGSVKDITMINAMLIQKFE